jgi:flagellar biosynthesis regulator FlbT
MDRISNERSAKSMTERDAYLARVRALVSSASDRLTLAERQEVEHLVDHDEIGEALRTLAWIIVDEDKRVPSSVLSGIRELSAGLISAEDLPPRLDSHAADES